MTAPISAIKGIEKNGNAKTLMFILGGIVAVYTIYALSIQVKAHRLQIQKLNEEKEKLKQSNQTT